MIKRITSKMAIRNETATTKTGTSQTETATLKIWNSHKSKWPQPKRPQWHNQNDKKAVLSQGNCTVPL